MTKEEKREIVREKCKEALVEIEKEIKSEKKTVKYLGYDFTLTNLELIKIKKEVEKMLKTLDKSIYIPSYPIFLLDLPSTPIRDLLMHVDYIYERYT